MSNFTNCPKCNSQNIYEYNNTVFCPDCAHEWPADMQEDIIDQSINDANGNILNDGDSVIVVKDLKVKGSSTAIKSGTKVKNIKLIHNPSDGHDIDCKIDGFGSMKLKSEFVKKA